MSMDSLRESLQHFLMFVKIDRSNISSYSDFAGFFFPMCF